MQKKCPFSIEEGLFTMDCNLDCALYDLDNGACSLSTSNKLLFDIYFDVSSIKESLNKS